MDIVGDIFEDPEKIVDLIATGYDLWILGRPAYSRDILPLDQVSGRGHTAPGATNFYLIFRPRDAGSDQSLIDENLEKKSITRIGEIPECSDQRSPWRLIKQPILKPYKCYVHFTNRDVVFDDQLIEDVVPDIKFGNPGINFARINSNGSYYGSGFSVWNEDITKGPDDLLVRLVYKGCPAGTMMLLSAKGDTDGIGPRTDINEAMTGPSA